MENVLPKQLPEERIIKAQTGLIGVNFAELWRYRELFFFLAWRDILVRYKQTGVGVAWALIRPLLQTIIFSVIFGKVAKLPSGGIPYPLLVLTGLLPWQFFANSLSQSSTSLVQNSNMISKIYFPRLVIPSSAILANVIDFLISLMILFGLMIWYGTVPTIAVLTLPLFFALAFFCTLGMSMWFSAMNVEYRDIQHIVPFFVQLGLYISPVAYATSAVVPEKWRLLYSLNPMVGVIDGFRWALLGEKVPLHYDGLLLSCSVVAILLVSGALYFRKMERTFADVI